MGVDIPNNRILHTGDSKTNPVYLWCVIKLPTHARYMSNIVSSLDYAAAAYADMFFNHSPSTFAARLVGLNELHPTMGEIEEMMHRKSGNAPQVAHDTVENAASQAKAGKLDGLVRKKMGDGTHGVGNDIWEVEGYQKKTLEDFILGDGLAGPKYNEPDEGTRHFLDAYFS